MMNVIDAAIGIDLGDRTARVCIYGRDRSMEEFAVPMVSGAFARMVEGRTFTVAVLEAGSQSAWVHRELVAAGQPTIIADSRKLGAISGSHRKCDRRDALMLAKLALADQSLLSPITPRSKAAIDGMANLVARDALVRGRTRLINAARSIMKTAGYRLAGSAPATFPALGAGLPTEMRPSIGPLMDCVSALNEQIAGFDALLEELAKQSFPQVRHLTQVSGVGIVTALAFALLVDDPARFTDVRTIGAYFGLVPRRDQSGDVDRQLRISKTGNGMMRRLLVQCAQIIISTRTADSDLQRFGRRLAAQGGGNGKKRAVIAVARKLAVMLLALWKKQSVWNPLYNEQSVATPAALNQAPKVPVRDDCAVPLGAGKPVRRGRDCSTASGLDPSMHPGQPASADRSVDRGAGSATTTSKPVEPTARAPKTETRNPTSMGLAEVPEPRASGPMSKRSTSSPASAQRGKHAT